MKSLIHPVWLDRDLLKKGLWIPLAFMLLLPPLCSVILNFEMEQQRITHIPMAIVDHDNSNLSRSLVEKIRTNETFDICEYGANDQEVKDWIDAGDVVAGIVIPEGFADDMLKGQAPQVLIIYDGSQMGAAGSARNRIAEIMATIRSGYLVEVVEGQLEITPAEALQYIQPVAYTSRFLGNPVKSLAYFFLQGLILGIVQVAVFILGIEMFFARPQNPGEQILDTIFCGLMGTLSAVLSLGIQVFVFNSPFNGSVTAGLALTVLNMTGIAALGVLFSIVLNDKLNAVSTGSVIMAMVLFSGYTFPAIAMPDIFQSVASILPFTHFGIPMRDITLLGSGWSHILPELRWLAGFVLLTWAVIPCLGWINCRVRAILIGRASHSGDGLRIEDLQISLEGVMNADAGTETGAETGAEAAEEAHAEETGEAHAEETGEAHAEETADTGTQVDKAAGTKVEANAGRESEKEPTGNEGMVR